MTKLYTGLAGVSSQKLFGLAGHCLLICHPRLSGILPVIQERLARKEPYVLPEYNLSVAEAKQRCRFSYLTTEDERV
jgi:hypothetical protein